LQLVCSLNALWLLRGRPQEGLGWFEAVFAAMNDLDVEVDAAVRVRALADSAVLTSFTVSTTGIEQAEEALAIARELDDRALLARALTACIGAAAFDAAAAQPYVAEAIDVARELGDEWRLCQILAWQAYTAGLTGHPVTMAAAGEEGQRLADAVGDGFMSRMCRYWGGGIASFQRGEVSLGLALIRGLLTEADAAADAFHSFLARIGLAHSLLLVGRYSEARVLADEAVELAPNLGPFLEPWAVAPLAQAALGAGDLAAATEANDVVWQKMTARPELAIANVAPMVELAFARGEISEARRWADEAVTLMTGWHLARALTNRAHIAIAQGDLEQSEGDAHHALGLAADIQVLQVVPDALEILMEVGCATGGHREAARFVGAAESIRQQQGGTVRFAIFEPAYSAAVANLRDVLGEEFDAARAEGAALSLEEAIAYAQRGRGERRRPSTGWESLTPTELDVVRLVGEGLGNKEIAARLFISHRTVQTHLTHVYGKLAITSRVQLAQEVVRRS
jgi:DNA-binding CsgD family transcriptional regulator